MSDLDAMRVRGTVIAIATFVLIVALTVTFDEGPVKPAASMDPPPSSLVVATVPTTIPVENRLCGLAQRLVESLPEEESEISFAMQGFYTEAASFTEGDLRGDLIAAARFYTEVNDIARKADWDVDRIVADKDGDRWRALLTGTPTGVEESRRQVREDCRTNLPEPPFIELDWSGRIRDSRLARLLEPVNREIYAPPAEPDPAPADEPIESPPR
ncbi:MAG: hypothetical protein ABI658_27895 [Acidimicrobiales bacterium]